MSLGSFANGGQVCRHPGVEKIDFCELDSMVCDVSKRFLSGSTATAFGDSRVSHQRRHPARLHF